MRRSPFLLAAVLLGCRVAPPSAPSLFEEAPTVAPPPTTSLRFEPLAGVADLAVRHRADRSARKLMPEIMGPGSRSST